MYKRQVLLDYTTGQILTAGEFQDVYKRQPKGGHIYNICAPAHPARNVFYPQMARLLGLEPPQFRNSLDSGKGKIICLLYTSCAVPTPGKNSLSASNTTSGSRLTLGS